jgi:hypothetical protein
MIKSLSPRLFAPLLAFFLALSAALADVHAEHTTGSSAKLLARSLLIGP